jgi:hypothetical protein
MSGCESHGELVGGFVLGALEPAEMEEMHTHLRGCPACEREARILGGLPALLDRIEPADVPPPTLSPDVEEAVLDRFARERPPPARRPWSAGRRLRLAALAAALVAATAVALLVALPSGDDEGDSAYATAKLAPPARDSDARATAYAGAVPAGTRVSLWARGLKQPRGAVYELWCVRADGGWVSGGTFRAGADGTARAELTAAVKPGDYHVMVVTRRAEAAPERTRGTLVLRGELRY